MSEIGILLENVGMVLFLITCLMFVSAVLLFERDGLTALLLFSLVPLVGAISNVLFAIGAALRHHWPAFVVFVVLVFLYFGWWRDEKNRRRRKRALELLGYKAEAIKKKIVRRMRQLPKSIPRLHPVPNFV